MRTNLQTTQSFVFISLATLLILGSFLLLAQQWKKERRTLNIGVYFSVFILTTIVSSLVIISTLWGSKGITVLEGLLFIFVLLLLMFSWFLSLVIIYYSIQLWKNEAHTIGNLITPIVFIMYLVFTFLAPIAVNYNEYFSILNMTLNLIAIYFIIVFINFFLASYLYGIMPPKLETDAVVVLGAGLIDGYKVSGLLGKRIQKGVSLAQELGTRSTLVMSGGQGRDELKPESQAMAEYALENFPVTANFNLIQETESKSTRENLIFSNKILNGKPFYFVTNDYHVFRAALLAKRLGINAQGRGAKTANYFKMSAFLREFVAVIAMNKKKHIFWIGLFVAFGLFIFLVSIMTGQTFTE